MRRDNLARIIALVILCGLVYWFSYDQGRSAMKHKVEVLEEKIRHQQEIIEAKSLEVRRLEARLKELAKELPVERAPESESITTIQRITLSPNASRTLFDARLILTCLNVDRDRNRALIQLTLVQEGRIRKVDIGVGGGVRFTVNQKEYTLILDQIQSSSTISVQIFAL